MTAYEDLYCVLVMKEGTITLNQLGKATQGLW